MKQINRKNTSTGEKWETFNIRLRQLFKIKYRKCNKY